MSNGDPSLPSVARIDVSRKPSARSGNSEDAIAGNYDFRIGALLCEAWSKSSGFKGPFWGGALVMLFTLIIAGWVLDFVFHITPLQGGVLSQLIAPIVITAVVYAFLTGVVMQGVHRAFDLPVTFSLTFGCLDVATPVIVAAVLSTILFNIGFMLLIIPGVYLSVVYLLVAPLIAD
jgi:hypothetical protein